MIDFDAARAILRENDRGSHTVPTRGLYPYQWNWDSAIIALGWLTFDEDRAWAEAHSMFRGQWRNGMLPHILFHGNAESYFPGPEIWGSETEVPSSAISQPPVWATAVNHMFKRSRRLPEARAHVERLLPKLVRYHEWWYRDRDRANTGLVQSFHPWESGMDNSPAWDDPLTRVPEVDWEYHRPDLRHVNKEERPHQPEYNRYLYLIDMQKRNAFDPERIYATSPYRVVDMGIVSILHRATQDLVELCREFGYEAPVVRLDAELERTQTAIGKCWSEAHRCFLNQDAVTSSTLAELTTGTLLPLFGHLATDNQATIMATLIDEWILASNYGVSSTHPASDRFEPQRYWRGPVWPHINWMIAEGLRDYGYEHLAERIKNEARKCIESSGYYEYYHAHTGTGCGGGNFSWTAAVALYWLNR